MSAWDIVLPHRLLINRSLRKASADLRTRIDEYKTDYELTIERCSAEIEQARADKDLDFEKVKLSLIDELSKDADLFEKVQAGLSEYVDLFLRRQCLNKMQEAKRLEKQALVEYRDFLSAQMSLIGEEIDILEARKDKLVAQAKVDDIMKLVRLTGCEVTVDYNDDAISLLAKVSEMVAACEVSDNLTKQALQKLRFVLQERADLLPVIQYITWMIQQKKELSRELSGDRRRTSVDIKNKTNELREMSESIDALSRSLEEQARAVRAYWVAPVTQLNIQINFLYKKLNAIFAEVKEIGERIEHIKRIGSDDSFTWDRLWREKNDLKEQIPQVKNEIESLKSKRKQWFARQQMLYSLCKKNNVYLIPDGKAEASDEYRIIDSRLAELLQIEKEANQHEEERFKRESAQIQQLRKAKINELSAKIASAEAVQAEKSIVISQASKQLSNSKSRDARFFLSKLFSETEEVSRAKQALQSATAQKKRADIELATLKTELAKATEEFDRQLVACGPKPYRPSSAESEEREKLEDRRTELDMHRQKKATQKEGRYDSQN
ncbi:hypothetical protein [Paenibacillus sp. BK720]|uniref:hypothetical protein n=1 Tax=Paenibacillus sp. BK720 TaxID=2587092 RepID=UPI00142244B3|nr:hypothetical protein [Paenibacillus sp. BK720]NIK70449.1 chromosome segregation ATPase [Paenibacillus sp. BK720]